MNILILCTGNSARSILAEALFNRLGEGRVTAFSAGSKPVGAVNPTAIRLLKAEGHDVSQFRSKSWGEFSGDGAASLDIVLTVCGNAAGETCPIWVGAPITVHWGFPDPAGVDGPDHVKLAAFRQVYEVLHKNITALLALDTAATSSEDLRSELVKIHTANPPIQF